MSDETLIEKVLRQNYGPSSFWDSQWLHMDYRGQLYIFDKPQAEELIRRQSDRIDELEREKEAERVVYERLLAKAEEKAAEARLALRKRGGDG